MSATVGTASIVDVKVGALDAARVCVGPDVVWQRTVTPPPAGGKAAVAYVNGAEGQAASIVLPKGTSGRTYIASISHQGNRDMGALPAGVTRLGAAGADNQVSAGAAFVEWTIVYWTGDGSGGDHTFTLASSGGFAWVLVEITAGTLDVAATVEDVSLATRTDPAWRTIAVSEEGDLALGFISWRNISSSTNATPVANILDRWTALGSTIIGDDGTQRVATGAWTRETLAGGTNVPRQDLGFAANHQGHTLTAIVRHP